MKRFILLFALLIPMLLTAQVSITKVGDALKVTGLGLGYPGIGNFNIYDEAYFTSVDQVLISGTRIFLVNSASKNIMADIKFSEISDKLGQATAKNYVETIIGLGYITPPSSVTGSITIVDTVATVSQIDSISGTVSTLYLPTVTEKIGTETGVVTYTSNVSVTLSGDYSNITSDAQIKYIMYVPGAGSGAKYLINGLDGVTITHSAGVVTVAGAGTPFASGDDYELGINAPKIETDYTTEAIKTIAQNPIWGRYTEPASLTTSDVTLTTSWADVGTEIDCRGYTDIIIYVTLDINAANDARLRALGKWESGGTDEYNLMIETVSAADIKIEDKYLEFNTDADQLAIILIHTGGIPYVQLQAQEGTDGGADAILTAPIKTNKIWR